VTADTPAAFTWLMNRADPTQNKLEIWYEGAPDDIELAIGLPGGDLVLSAGHTHELIVGGIRVGVAEHDGPVRGGRSRARILLHPPYFTAAQDPTGAPVRWPIRAVSRRRAAIKLHAWIERDDGIVQRSWLEPHDRAGTLGGFATATGAVVVGGINHHGTDGKPAPLPFSGRGPHPWSADRHIEWVQAPAYRLWGARSKTDGFSETSGTSAAVALVSGILAARHIGQRSADRFSFCHA
jgi:hypothetical protein